MSSILKIIATLRETQSLIETGARLQMSKTYVYMIKAIHNELNPSDPIITYPLPSQSNTQQKHTPSMREQYLRQYKDIVTAKPELTDAAIAQQIGITPPYLSRLLKYPYGPIKTKHTPKR